MTTRLAAPHGHPDADAIDLALAHLPASLENEYRGKLKSNDAGTLVELAFIGRIDGHGQGTFRPLGPPLDDHHPYGSRVSDILTGTLDRVFWVVAGPTR